MTGEKPVAIITGAARGIGLAAARKLLERDIDVVIADIDAEAAGLAATELGTLGSARGWAVDVSNTQSVNRLVEEVVEELGRLDVLVNNAGMIDPGPTNELSDERWDRLINVHLGGTFRCSRAAFPALVNSPAPAIVNVSSIAAHRAFSNRASYCAAKAGIEGLTRALAVEWAPHRVRVNAVAPGHTRTPLFDRAVETGVVPNLQARLDRIPLGRLAIADEVGAVIAFLASPQASYITGQAICVDGAITVNGNP